MEKYVTEIEFEIPSIIVIFSAKKNRHGKTVLRFFNYLAPRGRYFTVDGEHIRDTHRNIMLRVNTVSQVEWVYEK